MTDPKRTNLQLLNQMINLYRPTATTGKWLWACVVCIGLFVGCTKQPHATETRGMKQPEAFWMRVLLFGNLKECTITGYGSLVVEDPAMAVTARFTLPGQALPLRIDQGKLQIGDHLFSGDVWIRTESPFVFAVDGIPFRGHARIVPNEEGTAFSLINHVPLESYLCGVISAEMQSYWEPEALKAQAIASRTYCLYIKNRFGRGRHWDMKRSQAHQVYKGLSAETVTTSQAVFQTAGVVLVCTDANGKQTMFPAYYSSACGGHTENSRYVFGDEVPALQGVDCPHCRKTTRSEFFYWSGPVYSRSEITRRLTKRYPSLLRLESVERIEAARQSGDGRITSVRLTGKNGKSAFLRGEDFRLAIDPSGRKLKSAIFTIRQGPQGFEFVEGRGFGHGVGLCQSGAQALARSGKQYPEILQYYYPGSLLVKIKEQP